MWSCREGSFDKPLPMHPATHSLNAQRCSLRRARRRPGRGVWPSPSGSSGAWGEERTVCRQGRLSPGLALPASSCCLLRGTDRRPEAAFHSYSNLAVLLRQTGKQGSVRVSELARPQSQSESDKSDSDSNPGQTPRSLLHSTPLVHKASFSLTRRPSRAMLVTYHRRLCHCQSPLLPQHPQG